MKLTKSYIKELVFEAAAEYVWGVKKPGRVANQYVIKEKDMKLTKSHIKKAIMEELGQEQPEAAAAPEEKVQSDVSAVLKYIDKINNAKEFQQILAKVVEHAPNVPQGKLVLTKLLNSLRKTIQRMK